MPLQAPIRVFNAAMSSSPKWLASTSIGSSMILPGFPACAFLDHEQALTAAEIALAWVLRKPEISCAVIGTTRMRHLLANLQASGKTIDAGPSGENTQSSAEFRSVILDSAAPCDPSPQRRRLVRISCAA
jgi:hypothetical protein